MPQDEALIVISSSDEADKSPGKPANPSTSTNTTNSGDIDLKGGKNKITLGFLLKHCPRSTNTMTCDRCRIDQSHQSHKHPVLICHCSHSVTLHEGRSQNAIMHWKSGVLHRTPMLLFFC